MNASSSSAVMHRKIQGPEKVKQKLLNYKHACIGSKNGDQHAFDRYTHMARVQIQLPRKSNFFVTYFLPHPENKLMSPMLSNSHQVKSFTNLSRTLRITRQIRSLIVPKATKQDSHCGAISSNE